MKHKRSQRILGRKANHRKQLFHQLSDSLFRHGFVVTTQAKAKELRRVVEPLITEAKAELTLHRRRELLQKLGRKENLESLLRIAKEHKNRPGGYLRLTHLPMQRSDAAPLMRVDVIDSSNHTDES